MAYDEKKALDPASTSIAHASLAPRWNMVNTLLGGTDAMRAAGPAYLPQHPHESQVNYQNRLNTTTLFNMFELTLDSLVGKPFSDPIKFKNGDPPEQVSEFLKDVDFQGNNMHTFCRQWFREGLAKAVAYVHIERPRVFYPEDRPRTLKDDMDDNLRPYWNLISPERVLFMSYAMVNNVPVPEHVRIEEYDIQRVGYTESVVRQIRVLEIGSWYLLREFVDPKTKKVVWNRVDEGLTGLDYIPFFPFHANKDGCNAATKLPLEDLAYLNIRHWQSGSDQNNILTVARFPMLAVSGVHDTQATDVMTIGPRQLLATRAENGKFYYVEHEGKAIGAGNTDLEKLEQEMAAYGAEFLRKRPGGTTATARALDSAESSSPLQDVTLRFIDAVNLVLYYTMEMMGIEDRDVEITMTTDFGPEEVKDADMRVLAEARRNRDISRQGFLNELQRRGALADDFDYAENLRQLEKEPQIQSPFATGFNIDGSAKNNIDNKAPKKPPVSGDNNDDG